jgi:WD40 repeat protein
LERGYRHTGVYHRQPKSRPLLNGNVIASGSASGKIRLWDATTGRLHKLIKTGVENWITSVAISGDGKLLVVGYKDGSLWLSETATPMDMKDQPQADNENSIMAVAFSGDGLFVVSGSTDHTAKVWSAKTGLKLSTVSHAGPITSVALSGDGRLAVSGSNDCTARVWEAATGKTVHIFTGHTQRVASVAFSGNDKLVVSGSYDHTVRVWDVMSGTHLYTISDHGNWVNSVAFSDDSHFIISGSTDGTIRIWDAATGTHQQTITGHGIGSVAFSDGEGSIISRSIINGTTRVWEASTALTTDGASLPRYMEAPDSLRHDQFKLKRDGWIYRLNTRNSWQRLCWLPTECRGCVIAYYGQTVCIATGDGTLIILDFSRIRIL